MTAFRHVELWGYPGAGKSTVAAMLKADPRIEIAVMSAPGDGASLLRSRLRNLDLLRTYLPPMTELKSKQRRLAAAAVRQQAAFSRAKGPALMEEGVAHVLWRMLYTEPEVAEEAWWRRFARYAGPTVVVLDLPVDAARQRIASKKAPGPINQELLAAPLTGEEWLSARLAFDVVLRALGACEKVQVIRLDVTGLTPAQVCEEVVGITTGRQEAERRRRTA